MVDTIDLVGVVTQGIVLEGGLGNPALKAMVLEVLMIRLPPKNFTMRWWKPMREEKSRPGSRKIC